MIGFTERNDRRRSWRRERRAGMKKTAAVLMLFAAFCGLAGCAGKPEAEVRIDYGSSSLYSKEDMDEAIERIKAEFGTWRGCELHSITYGSDAACSEENIAWMNKLEAANDAQETFSQCILFKSDFHSPKNGGGAWNTDQEYNGWQWWLARSENGSWKLMTWGYG